MNHHHDTVFKMAGMTAAGWTLSLADVETAIRLLSLIIPATLSVVVFVRDWKRKKNEKKN